MSEVAARLRSQKRTWAHPGSGHDRIVRIALLLLPLGIGVLAAFLVVAPLTLAGDVSFVLDKNRVAVSPERLRIDSAQYRGEDSRGRAFQLNAESAVQRSSAEPVVQLKGLSASIALHDGPASFQADRGHYDLNREQVSVDGPIRFQAANGYALNTRDATVDLKTRQMRSGGAVDGTTPMGSFSGNRMTADLENRTVAIEGNARLRIIPKRANRR